MSSSFFKSFKILFISIIIFILFLSCFFGPTILNGSFSTAPLTPSYTLDLNSEYIWPSPGYTSINSYFGKRTSPTAGASSFHKGLDIAAPQGSKLVAVCDGKITFANFLGGGGYTITLTSGNMKFTYSHVSPNFIVKVGDTVKKGDVIGSVGPKNVYGVLGNQYKDANGNPTNGATTGPHLHFGLRIDGNYKDPFILFKN